MKEHSLQNPMVDPVMVSAGFSQLNNIVEQDLPIFVQYPEHGERKASRLYRKNRKKLVIEQDTPCFICGIRYSTGGSMETHHFFVEWAATNAINWKNFGVSFEAWNPQSEANFDWNEVSRKPELFVDSMDNLMVLCSEHHRAPQMGIHCTPYPIWILQKWPTNNFEFVPRPIDKND